MPYTNPLNPSPTTISPQMLQLIMLMAQQQQQKPTGITQILKNKKSQDLVKKLLGLGGAGAGGAYLLGNSTPAVPSILAANFVPGAASSTGASLAGGVAGSEAASSAASAAAQNAASGAAGAEAATTLGSVAPYLGVAGAGLGAYGLKKAIDSNNAKSGALSGAALGGGLAAASPLLLGGGPVGWGVLGLSALGGGLGGAGLTKLLGHETTRQLAKKHTGQLLKSSNDSDYQNYVKGMRAQFDQAPPDPSKPFHGGQYGSWDEYKKAGLDANDLTGVYGNIKTFGPEWSKLSQDQRVGITKGIIDAGLYNSKKGEVEITDPTKALEIKNSFLTKPPTPTSNKPSTTSIDPGFNIQTASDSELLNRLREMFK